jgi:hypothetical protein
MMTTLVTMMTMIGSRKLTSDSWAQTFLSDDEIEPLIEYCLLSMRNHPRNKQGQAILLIGEPGAGKSAILRAVVRRAQNELAEKGATRGAVMMDMPIPCTNRAISLEYRRALGDEAMSGGANENMEVVRKLWQAHQTQFLGIDEGHNMGSDKGDFATSKRQFVKRTLNEFKAICVFAGTEALVPLFASDGELKRRTRRTLRVPTLNWSDPDQRTTYCKFLRRLDKATGMPVRGGFNKLDLAIRFAAATRCLRGITYDLISYARVIALYEGAEQITDAHLERAFFEFIAQDDPKVVNPFDPNRRI